MSYPAMMMIVAMSNLQRARQKRILCRSMRSRKVMSPPLEGAMATKGQRTMKAIHQSEQKVSVPDRGCTRTFKRRQMLSASSQPQRVRSEHSRMEALKCRSDECESMT
mmetsp:Transcript_97835/g.154762  ORF Transcript_97835/g.154762 Transcript_97835/m.154762 type:complete len:108 (-) Transcript_97835:34-357(-)